MTSDGHKAYVDAIETAFGADVDYAQFVKIYGQPPEGQRRYSPPVIVGTETNCCTGSPDKAHISTSYVERQNLSMRMGIRRFNASVDFLAYRQSIGLLSGQKWP
jgi:hypothetical protein